MVKFRTYITALLILAIGVLGSLAQKANALVVEDEQFYTWCDSDINNDGKVDLKDWALLAKDYLTHGSMSTENTTGTNIDKEYGVDVNDISNFAENWLRNAEQEFGTDYGKIVVGVRKIYDPDPNAPTEIASEIRIINDLNNGGGGFEYFIEKVISNMGTAQGLTSFEQIANWIPEPSWWENDPNKLLQETIGSTTYPISPGSSKLFILYVEDPNSNNLIFKNKLIEVSGELQPNFNTVNVPMPHNKSMAE